MHNADVLFLAMAVLSPSEVDECFARAFRKLNGDEQELVGAAAVDMWRDVKLHNGQEALEVTAKAGIFLAMRPVMGHPA